MYNETRNVYIRHTPQMTNRPWSTKLTWEGHLSLPLKLKGHDDSNDTQDEKDDDEYACSSTHCPTHSDQVAVVSIYCSDIKEVSVRVVQT